MQTVYQGMVIAAAMGALTGGTIQVQHYFPGDRPGGPQQIYSVPGVHGDQEAYGYTAITFPSGPFADFVIGRDWLPGGRHDRAAQQASYTLPVYEPLPVDEADLFKKYGIWDYAAVAATPAPAPVASSAQAATDHAREAVEVIRIDSEGGGQIDDLAHRSDPGAQVSEPAA